MIFEPSHMYALVEEDFVLIPNQDTGPRQAASLLPPASATHRADQEDLPGHRGGKATTSRRSDSLRTAEPGTVCTGQ